MAEFVLPEFEINKDEPEEGLKKLIKIIKPQWNHEDVVLDPISGGYSSKIYKCFDKNESKDEAVTVRIRYMKDVLKVEHVGDELEKQIIQVLSKTGHFPKVKAVFGNGYAYEYIKGRPVFNMKDKVGTMDTKMLKQFVKTFVNLHSLKLDNVDYKSDQFYDKITKLLDPFPFKLEHELAPTKETITKEFEYLKVYLKSIQCPITICHGDPHPGNMVWNEEEEKLTLLDWEGVYTGRYYFDLGQFCAAMQMFQELQFDSSSLVFPKDWATDFPKLYFDEWCKKKGKEFDEEEFSKFKSEVKKSELGYWLLVVVMSCAFPQAGEAFAGNSYKFYEYCSRKYLALKEKYAGNGKYEADSKK